MCMQIHVYSFENFLRHYTFDSQLSENFVKSNWNWHFCVYNAEHTWTFEGAVGMFLKLAWLRTKLFVLWEYLTTSASEIRLRGFLLGRSIHGSRPKGDCVLTQRHWRNQLDWWQTQYRWTSQQRHTVLFSEKSRLNLSLSYNSIIMIAYYFLPLKGLLSSPLHPVKITSSN